MKLRFLAILSLACGSAAGTDARLDRAALPGRLFFVAYDRVHAPPPGHPITRKLYVIPASGAAAPIEVISDELVSGLVGYPARHAVGVNLSAGPNRSSFLIDTGAPHFLKTPLIPWEVQSPFSSPDWTTPDAPPAMQAQRYLSTQITVAPDGQRVAGIMGPGMRMCIAPTSGNEPLLCAVEVRACDSHFASWSPDGKAIVFAGAIKADRSSCNLHELFIMDTSTGVTRQLTDIPGDRLGREMREAIVVKGDATDRRHKSNHPVWSPDAQWIAFNSPKGISLIHPDGTGLHVIIKPLGIDPAWSPDGTLIAYLVPHRGAGDKRRFPRRFDIPWVIHVSRADGAGDTQISDDSGALAVMELVWMD
ncbi:TolB family protein [Luteibacter aegosomatissinici]|uniref:TolB family protein n=1 Tax=Luteibacter aegosomatissinici TaxID=2911539 RepID=UPI001FFACC59|nr:hypothetical protein [Luteibacter aegosomatissinici]UPG96597.1 hypothetical protein L2Y97_10905 [Luteibacter aegosomatissinici]